jgi:hypothetical protein
VNIDISPSNAKVWATRALDEELIFRTGG